jgi:hypothetical protein
VKSDRQIIRVRSKSKERIECRQEQSPGYAEAGCSEVKRGIIINMSIKRIMVKLLSTDTLGDGSSSESGGFEVVIF